MKIVKQIIVDEIPDVGDGMIEHEKLVNVMLTGGLQSFITHNTTGNLASYSFVLNRAYDWTLAKNEDGVVVLVPLRK